MRSIHMLLKVLRARIVCGAVDLDRHKKALTSRALKVYGFRLLKIECLPQ